MTPARPGPSVRRAHRRSSGGSACTQRDERRWPCSWSPRRRQRAAAEAEAQAGARRRSARRSRRSRSGSPTPTREPRPPGCSTSCATSRSSYGAVTIEIVTAPNQSLDYEGDIVRATHPAGGTWPGWGPNARQRRGPGGRRAAGAVPHRQLCDAEQGAARADRTAAHRRHVEGGGDGARTDPRPPELPRHHSADRLAGRPRRKAHASLRSLAQRGRGLRRTGRNPRAAQRHDGQGHRRDEETPPVRHRQQRADLVRRRVPRLHLHAGRTHLAEDRGALRRTRPIRPLAGRDTAAPARRRRARRTRSRAGARHRGRLRAVREDLPPRRQRGRSSTRASATR